MYSNDKRNGFSILDIIVKIILFGLFIFILVWLFNKKVPNMTPFYSNVFRENIKYMQEAGESYFTDDKMPKKVGEEVKMTLSQMIDQKLIIPFVDEDGNSCDVYNSYVSITKQEDESYHLKTNLKCNTEEDYTIKVLGCHTYCKNNSCEKKCYKEQLTSYQYQQQVTNTTTKYSCKEGYSLNGKYCYRTVLADSYNAEVNVTTTKKDVIDALYRVTGGKITEVKPNKETGKSYYDKTIVETINETETINATSKKETIEATINTDTKDAKPNTSTSTIDATKSTSTKKVYVDVIKNKTEDKKVCTSGGYTNSYPCNCTGSWSGGQYHTVCSTCTEYIPTESCSTVPGTTTYTCPTGAKKEGSGSSTKCYKTEDVVTYTCPSGYTKNGTKCTTSTTTYSCDSGYTLKGTKCTKTTYSCNSGYTLNGTKCERTVYTCPSGYTKNGTKCTKTTVTCPSGYTKNGTKCVINKCPQQYSIQEGSGLNKKCYTTTETIYTCPEGFKLINKKVCQKVENASKVEYYCEDPTYKLEGTKCVKEIKENSKKYECAEGYKLEGTVCKKYTTDKVNATAQKVTNKSYKYTWSTNPSLSGWTKTGKTKIIEGKEICE